MQELAVAGQAVAAGDGLGSSASSSSSRGSTAAM